MIIKDSKVWRIAGQNQPVIGPPDRTIRYPDPGPRVLYTLVPPNYLYFTWEGVKPTASAFSGDASINTLWADGTGDSLSEDGVNTWVVSASLGSSPVRWGRRFGLHPDAADVPADVNFWPPFTSDKTVPAPILNAMLSGNFYVSYWLRRPTEFNLNGLANVGVRPVFSITRPAGEVDATFKFGNYVKNGFRCFPGFACFSGTTGGVVEATASYQIEDNRWHYFCWNVVRDIAGQGSVSLSIDGGEAVAFETGRTASLSGPAGTTLGTNAQTLLLPSSGSYDFRFYMGTTGRNDGACVQSDLAEVVIGSGTLSTGQITALYATGSNATAPNKVAYWSMNDTPITDTLRNWPLTIRTDSGSFPRMFGSNGYIEIDQLQAKEYIGCLIGPPDHVLSHTMASGSYTLEAWVSCSSVDVVPRTICAFSADQLRNRVETGMLAHLYVDQNKNVCFDLSSGSNNPVTGTIFTALTMSLNTWNHLQLTVQRDPSDIFFMSASCYINGVSAGTHVYRTGPRNGLSGSMWVGMRPSPAGPNNATLLDKTLTATWAGRIGHLKVWKDVARSQAEAQAVYANELHYYDDKG